MNKFKTLLIFTTGVAVGSAVTWKLLKTKYEMIAQEEIDSVKEAFFKSHEESDDSEDDADSSDDEEAPTVPMKYAAILQREEYVDREEVVDDSEELDDICDEPYVIPPEEFGEKDYTQISLTYFADGVLADDIDGMVEDVESCVGSESLSHFGEYEDDSVYVRNDRLKIDYEILLDVRTYADFMKTRPHLREE